MTECTPEVRVQLQGIPYLRPVTNQPQRLDWVDRSLGLFLFSSIGRMLAATYYVSTSGSDSNPGSWPALAHYSESRQHRRGGDTVTVRAGTYYERVQINVSGTTSQPITFQGSGV
jgi:hypothetical protein